MDQQSSQMLVASLTDPHEDRSVPAGMLARDQAPSGGLVAPIVEVVTIPHCGDDGSRRLGADTPYPTDALAGLVRAKDQLDTPVEFLHPLVDFHHQLKKRGQDLSAKICQIVVLIVDELGEHAPCARDRLAEGDASIQEYLPI